MPFIVFYNFLFVSSSAEDNKQQNGFTEAVDKPSVLTETKDKSDVLTEVEDKQDTLTDADYSDEPDELADPYSDESPDEVNNYGKTNSLTFALLKLYSLTGLSKF